MTIAGKHPITHCNPKPLRIADQENSSELRHDFACLNWRYLSDDCCVPGSDCSVVADKDVPDTWQFGRRDSDGGSERGR